MTYIHFWNVLGIISILGLIIAVINPMRLSAKTFDEKYMHRVSVIWAPFVTLGIIGIIVALFREGEYSWNFVLKFAIIGVLIGIVGELVAFVQRVKKRKKNSVVD